MTELLDIRNVSKTFAMGGGWFRRADRNIQTAVDINLTVNEGEIVGLVGESGCGKTTLGRMIVRLIDPSSGAIHFEGDDIAGLNGSDLKAFRRQVQMIFQDPFGSLNPRMRVRDLVGEGFLIHKIVPKNEIPGRVEELLNTVGLGSDALSKYPHEFSGGQRQRIGIARALSVGPRLLIADEPVSALDVSVQAQIVNLLLDLKDQRKLSYLFISHDLRVVEFMATRVAVMYLGRIVELLPTGALSKTAVHPYTKALLSSVPTLDPETKKLRLRVLGDIPDAANPPSGCVFHPRCPLAEARCKTEVPVLRQVEAGHDVACHLV